MIPQYYQGKDNCQGDGASEHHCDAVEEMYRKEYFEVIDNVKGKLEKRFRQQNFL